MIQQCCSPGVRGKSWSRRLSTVVYDLPAPAGAQDNYSRAAPQSCAGGELLRDNLVNAPLVRNYDDSNG
jgi:hypothetical protein